jgi:predicted esterase
MPYGTLDLRLAKSPTRYYYLQEGITFSYRESSPGVRTNTYASMTNWNTSAYGQGNLREVNGTADNFVMNYRLLKPSHYDPSYSPGYPIIIMFHGAGESANCWVDERCYWSTASYNPIVNNPPAPKDQFNKLLNNDRNLLHGGAQHLTAVNLAGSRLPDDPNMPARAFPGFVLFPQSLNGWGPHTTVEDAIRILRLIIKKYNIDESRVYIHGLSNGGGGVYQALKRAPWLFAAALPMSAVTDGGFAVQGLAPEVSKIPFWIFQGGLDINPTPQRTYNTVRSLRDVGGDVRYYLYENLGHGTWNTAYKEPDFFSWMLEKRKYNPHIVYGSPFICNTTQAGVRIAFSSGFFAYQWQRDGQILSGETGSEITANVPGTYRGRFSRKPNPTEADWERWSDPIVVSELNPEKPSVDVIGTAHLRGPGLASTDANNTVQLRSTEPAELYNWFKNGSPINFAGTDVEDTLRLATFVNAFTGGNGTYTLVARNYNCPSPPSDPVNLFFNNSSPQVISISAEAVDLKATVSSSSIFLNWNDVSSRENGYEIWRRKAGTSDFKFVAKTAPDAISYLDSALDPGTTYEYKMRAVNNSGRSNYVPSDDPAVNYQFTTGGDFHFPSPPQNLTAVTNTLNSIILSWTPASDDGNIRGYYVYFNGDSVSTDTTATSYTLGGLTQNNVYAITVKAVDFGNHYSQPSNQIIATTYLSGLLYKHSTGAFLSLDDSAMIATWEHPEFTGTVPNFTLQPRTQEDYFNFQFTGYLNIETEGTYYFTISSDDGSRLILDGQVIANNDGRHGNKTVASDTVFLTAGPHAIEVQYFDDINGNTLTVRYKGPGIGDGTSFVVIPDSALRSGTYIPAVPPAPPAELTALGAGMQQIDLNWQFADDAGTEFEVYRSTAGGGPFEMVARAEGTSAVDSIALLPGVTYFYKVKTVNQNGSSPFSSMASATTASDTLAPSTPQELAVIGKSLTNLSFSWKASTDNVGVTVYEIFAGDELIGTSTINAFTAENILPNTEYVFTVRAVDASGNRSQPSAAVSASTKASAIYYSAPAGNLNDIATWHRNADGTGESPLNFSDNGQYFVVSNRTSASPGGEWIIEGSASRVIIPEGVTLTADQPFSANVELQGTAVLNLNNPSAPRLVKLAPASTVNFNAYPSIPANIYGNVILSGLTPKTFDPDTVTILGNLTVGDGLALKGSPHNSSHIRVGGGVTLQGSRPATATDNAVHLEFISGTSHDLATSGDVYLYRIIMSESQTLNVANPSGTPLKINLGSLNGGGLLLNTGSKLNLNEHSLIIREGGSINPGEQSGSLAADGGDLYLSSTSGLSSNLFFDAAHHTLNYFQIDLTGSGIASVRTPVLITDGVRVKNGTLAAGGNVTLLASASHTARIYEIENSGKITGEVTAQKYLEPRGRVYQYLAAPVGDVTVAEWQSSFPITGKFAGASPGSDTPSMFYYKQASGGWVAYPPPGGSNTASIEKGVGYSALLKNETSGIILASKGNPYQGTVSFALSPSAGGVVDDGWNLIGNPFASPVRWDNSPEAWTRSGVSNVIAMRKNTVVNGATRSQVTYLDATLGGGTVPAGEAFWVKTFAGSPALSVTEKAKADSAEASPEPLSFVVVSLKQGDVADPVHIAFTDGATAGYDPKYDGRKLKNYGMFNLSAIAGDTVLLAINHLSPEACSQTVSLDVADAPPGLYALAFENLGSLTDIGEVILRDNFTSTSTKVTGAEYSFSVTSDPNSYGNNRFSLTFNKQLLDLTTPKVQSADVCAPGPGNLIVSASQAGVVYYAVNASGKKISAEATGNGESLELDLLPGELVTGPNKIRISAGFPGCDRQFLPGEFVVNLVPSLAVNSEGDVSICEGEDVTLEASGAPVGGFYKWFNGDGTLIAGATSHSLLVEDVMSEEVFYVSTAHPNGCESPKAEIHIYPDTLGMPTVFIQDDTLYTEVVAFYQWKKDGVSIEGATLPYLIPSESGSYTVVASQEGCVKESAPYVYSQDGAPGGDGGNPGGDGDSDGGDGDGDPVTGIDNGNTAEFDLQVYPIPTSGHSINVVLRSPGTEPVLIEIIDLLGRLHFSGLVDAGAAHNGVTVQPPAALYEGLYFLRATQGVTKARRKIVVKD